MKCHHCQKKKFTLLCKFCNNNFCTACLQVESHSCENIEQCIEKQKEELKEKLNDEATHDNKMRCVKIT